MVNADIENKVFTAAAEFICNSNLPVFLTGKAGTGKTTFLKYIRENSGKNTVTVAPTGVASINAGGTTIHSFFQLPFSPYIPGKNKWGDSVSLDKNSLLSKLRLSSERKEIMQELELLIIDEISMVRCDVLDAIDTVLRYARNQPGKAFGGVQLLYIGDLYQLPPVVKENEWSLLNDYYENPYFFSSRAILDNPPVYIELKKVYRQADQSFINLLNKVRNNEMDETDLAFLHSRYDPLFKPLKSENYITLTTHNHKADEINRGELSNLQGEVFTFKASIEGEFYDNAYPAEEFLNIKTGAQVMFLKNDMEKVRRYYNGKIGIVEKVEEDKVWVKCNTDGSELLIEVKRETWRNIKYILDKKSQQLDEKELGSFTQFPLRLAWAITIHKSQGLTFEKAIIDAGSAFAPGQVYVALSRCTSMEGIVLRSRIAVKSLHSDDRIVQFCSLQGSMHSGDTALFNAKRAYQHEIIHELFDFKNCISVFNGLSQLVTEHNSFGNNVAHWLAQIKEKLDIFSRHGDKFDEVINALSTQNELPEENQLIRERLVKAKTWFVIEFIKLKTLLQQSPAITDNRQLGADYNSSLQELWDNICRKMHLMSGITNDGFSVEYYRQYKARYTNELLAVNAYSGKSSYVPTDILHPELFKALKDKRDMIARERGMPLYMVCGTISIEQMTNYLPLTLPQLELISGFGKTKLKQFGDDFIYIIREYCSLNNLAPAEIKLPNKKQKKENKKGKKNPDKPDTKKLSFELYKTGKSILEISVTRNLSATTIEGHLSHFVETGDIDVNEFVESKKLDLITAVISKVGSSSLQKIKEQLPEISYGEIKWALAAWKLSTAIQ